jgi:hypothetical protein
VEYVTPVEPAERLRPPFKGLGGLAIGGFRHPRSPLLRPERQAES